MGTGEFGTEKRPVILDVSQLIRKVNWIVGNDTILIRVNAKLRKPSTPDITIDSDFSVVTGDVFANSINIHDDFIPTPPIVLPNATPLMFKHTYAWNKPTPLKTTDETLNIYTTLIFFNLTRIKAHNKPTALDYLIKLMFPASTRKTKTTINYWAFADPFGNPFDYYQLHPQTTGAIIDAFGHTGIVGNTLLFGSASQRDAFLGFNAGSLPPWRSYDEPSPEKLSDLFQWDIKVWTLKSAKSFPVNLADYMPTFDDSKVRGFKQDKAGAYVETDNLPAYTVKMTVTFKTLALTMSRA